MHSSSSDTLVAQPGGGGGGGTCGGGGGWGTKAGREPPRPLSARPRHTLSSRRSSSVARSTDFSECSTHATKHAPAREPRGGRAAGMAHFPRPALASRRPRRRSRRQRRRTVWHPRPLRSDYRRCNDMFFSAMSLPTAGTTAIDIDSESSRPRRGANTIEGGHTVMPWCGLETLARALRLSARKAAVPAAAASERSSVAHEVKWVPPWPCLWDMPSRHKRRRPGRGPHLWHRALKEAQKKGNG